MISQVVDSIRRDYPLSSFSPGMIRDAAVTIDQQHPGLCLGELTEMTLDHLIEQQDRVLSIKQVAQEYGIPVEYLVECMIRDGLIEQLGPDEYAVTVHGILSGNVTPNSFPLEWAVD